MKPKNSKKLRKKNSSLRVAVVQTLCHLAVYIEEKDCMAEPFRSRSGQQILGNLARKLPRLETSNLQEHCRTTYLKWASERLDSILSNLLYEENVELVVFPEFSIPFEHLHIIARHAAVSGATIVCANHGFSGSISDYKNLPKELSELVGEIDTSEIGTSNTEKFTPTFEFDHETDQNQNFGYSDNLHGACNSVMITFHPSKKFFKSRKIEISCAFKSHLSPFEYTESFQHLLGGTKNKVSKPIKIKHPHEYKIQVLICAEALQTPDIAPDSDILVICACHARPDEFDPIVETNTRESKTVILASDGTYGGSRIWQNFDDRIPRYWSSKQQKGKLPPGESVVIYEISTSPSSSRKGNTSIIQQERLISVIPISAVDLNCKTYKTLNRFTHLKNKIEAHFFDNDGITISKKNQHQIFGDIDNILNTIENGTLEFFCWHYLRRRAKEKTLTKIEIETFGKCIFYGNKEPTSKKDDSSGAISYSSLERKLARRVHTWIRTNTSIIDYDGPTSAIFSEILEECRTYFSPKKKLTPVAALESYFNEQRQLVLKKSHEELHQCLGSIIETYKASSAWLFSYSQNKKDLTHVDSNEYLGVLEEVISHNIVLSGESLRFPVPKEKIPKCGISSLVIQERRGLIIGDLTKSSDQKFYKGDYGKAKSIISVPIFQLDFSSNDHDPIIGVLTLESTDENAFVKSQIGSLQARSLSFVRDLLIIDNATESSSLGIWHPLINQWQIERSLNEICNTISTSVSEDPRKQALGCTIWHADWFKMALYARGAARFNYEYFRDKALSLNSKSSPDNVTHDYKSIPKEAWNAEIESFSAEVASKADDKVYKKDVATAANYARKIKAATMGIEKVVAKKFHWHEREGGDLRVPHSTLGVVSLYFFNSSEADDEYNVQDRFPDHVVQELSHLIGKYITEVLLLKYKAATASLHAKLAKRGISHVNMYEIFRDCVKRYIGGNALTLAFTRYIDSQSREIAMDVISSSQGLKANDSDSKFKLKHSSHQENGTNWTIFQGFTALLHEFPGSVIRKNDIPDPWEIGCIYKLGKHRKSSNLSAKPKNTLIKPSNILNEQGEPTELDHRRFIGISAKLPNNENFVIRLVRNPRARPFVHADSKLLIDLCAQFVPMVESNETHTSTQNTISLDYPQNHLAFWNQSYLEATLQKIIVSIKDKEKLYTNHLKELPKLEISGADVRVVNNSKIWGALAQFTVTSFYQTFETESPCGQSWDKAYYPSKIILCIESNDQKENIDFCKLKFLKNKKRFIIRFPFTVDPLSFSEEDVTDHFLTIYGYVDSKKLNIQNLESIKSFFSRQIVPILSKGVRLMQCLGHRNVTGHRRNFLMSPPLEKSFSKEIGRLFSECQTHFRSKQELGYMKITLWYAGFASNSIFIPLSKDEGVQLRNLTNKWRNQQIFSSHQNWVPPLDFNDSEEAATKNLFTIELSGHIVI